MSEIQLGRMAIGIYQTNCYYLYRDGQTEAIVVDPADCGAEIAMALRDKGLSVAAILLTHGHFDHIWGVEELKRAASEQESADATGEAVRASEKKTADLTGEGAQKSAQGVLVYAGEAEKALLADPEMNVSADMRRPTSITADVWVKDGQTLSLAGIEIQVLATPGHTAGGVCYYVPEAHLVLCGDTIFCESVGRTDFPTGSMSTLVRSIREKLLPLPEETVLYPGHGESTTVGNEKQYNPFLV